MQQYIENHPEKYLLACVWSKTADWLKRIVPDDSDRYVMLVAANLVNCVAFVPMPAFEERCETYEQPTAAYDAIYCGFIERLLAVLHPMFQCTGREADRPELDNVRLEPIQMIGCAGEAVFSNG